MNTYLVDKIKRLAEEEAARKKETEERRRLSLDGKHEKLATQKGQCAKFFGTGKGAGAGTKGRAGSLLNRILGSHETEASASSNFDMASWMCSCRSPVAATTYSSIEPTA